MTYAVEKYISNFVRKQFPSFYDEEGENFLMFVEAYYEWMEENRNPIHEARSLFDYRDIDTTLEQFLVHFQQKYLYGIPFQIISNKRFLLKHILDVYRSKGTTRCYELLFKLIYDEDVEIYYPRRDMLKASDGKWVEPMYLEVTDSSVLNSLVGKQIVGTLSGTTAVIEKFNRESVNKNVVNLIYISNVKPQGGDFTIGERLIAYPDSSLYSLDLAPTVIGSFTSLEIINGGFGFREGDILKIAERIPSTNTSASYGRGALIQVTDTVRAQGSLTFYISNHGFGYTANANIFFYNEIGDNSGHAASFDLGPMSQKKSITYNTDVLVDYLNVPLNSLSFGFSNTAVNVSSQISAGLTFANDIFGSVFTITNINAGNNYIYSPKIKIRSSLLSRSQGGTITYNKANVNVITLGRPVYSTTSNTINGTGTFFSTVFSNGDIIALKSSNTSPLEFHIVNAVVSNTQLILRDTPLANSTSNAVYYKVSGVIGTGTSFTTLFTNSDIITLRANSSLANTTESISIRAVVNDSLIVLYGAPTINSTGSAQYFVSPPIMTSSFAKYEPIMYQTDGSIPGINALVVGRPNNGNSIVGSAISYNSGRGYYDGELVRAYFYNGISTPLVLAGGVGYANDELIEFSGGSPSIVANAFITTNTSGGIIDVTMIDTGANYVTLPTARVLSANVLAHGAKFSMAIQSPDTYNTSSYVLGKIRKSGIGYAPGYWASTDGFLNSDKYLTDSYFYQDYSYQIKTATTLDKYKNIIYNTFHTAGMELFGGYLSIDTVQSPTLILSEQTTIG